MSRDSHEKRQREKKRQERAAEKRQRRETRGVGDPDLDGAEPSGATDDELMERFRILSEQRAAGVINEAAFEVERKAIFAELGLADPFSD